MRKVLNEDYYDSMSIDDVLAKASVTRSQNEEALTTTASGLVVVYKRKPNECNINNYNPRVMIACQANMDIQYALNAYTCVMYVASYIMKTDSAMGVLLKRVATATRTEELKTQMKRVGAAFLDHREVSAQEAADRILPLPMKSTDRAIVFVDTNTKKERIGVLKNSAQINELDDNDCNVFCKNLLDRHQHRPLQLQNMCLAQFAADYVTYYKGDDDDVTHSDVLSSVTTGDSTELSRLHSHLAMVK